MVINGMLPDHLHILLRLKFNISLSDLVRDAKANSSIWFDEKNFTAGKFEWQEGFWALSLGQSQLPVIIKYIKNQ